MVTKSNYLQQLLVTDPKIVLKAPSAPIFTNIEGGARAEKRIFFSIFFKKCLKLTFSACLFKIMPAAQKFWPKQGLFSALAELEKLIRPTYKKKVDKKFENCHSYENWYKTNTLIHKPHLKHLSN